ncbi:MAG: hypothetical protein ABIH34_01330 [Nanoarchaeota archaeon]
MAEESNESAGKIDNIIAEMKEGHAQKFEKAYRHLIDMGFSETRDHSFLKIMDLEQVVETDDSGNVVAWKELGRVNIEAQYDTQQGNTPVIMKMKVPYIQDMPEGIAEEDRRDVWLILLRLENASSRDLRNRVGSQAEVRVINPCKTSIHKMQSVHLLTQGTTPTRAYARLEGVLSTLGYQLSSPG